MTKFKAFVFTYDRPEMLKSVLDTLSDKGITPTIKDDAILKRGKEGFWESWDEVLKECIGVDADIFLFMPDDFLDLDVERVIELHEQFKEKPYIYNIINDGREKIWTSQDVKEYDDNTELVGFTDGGFFCNLWALIKIGFFMDDCYEFLDKKTSSGVGLSLTYRANRFGVPCYRPIKSLAYHGDHESKMHPTERLKNPLISK